MDIDYYIDWQTARSMLMEAAEAVQRGIRLCNIMLIKSNTVAVHDELTADLIGSLDLSDDQVKQLSALYVNSVRDIRFTAETLGGGEINNDPE